ncbi:MAG: hypothetical protein V4474_02415 [Patescibacteria group bacterium]
MADEAPPGNPLHNLYGFIAFLVLLVILWFAAGGPSRADLRGILLHAPEPLDNGNAYGPNPASPGQDTYYQQTTVTAPAPIGTPATTSNQY